MAMGWPQTASIVDNGVLPALLAKGRLHAGLIVALLAAVLVWAVMRFTVLGYEIKAVGFNTKAAEFSGINVNKTVIYTALISGGLAGIAGVSEVAGLKGYLTRSSSSEIITVFIFKFLAAEESMLPSCPPPIIPIVGFDI